MRRRRLAAAAVVALVLRGVAAWAGGNIQVRAPDDPSRIISTRWDPRRFPIHWVLSQDGLPGSGIDNPMLETEIKAAFDTWDALPTLAVDFVYDGQVPLRDGRAPGALGPGIDGHNLVTFTDPDQLFPTGILGLTLITAFADDTVVTAANADLDGDGTPDLPTGTYAAGTVFDADITFNAGVDWAVSGAPGTFDVQAVALHEVGHFLGLCHSAVRHAVMWPFIREDVLTLRHPTPDDVAWVSFLYPKEPAFSATFGSIAGRITNGANGLPVLGAHVYTVDPITQGAVVGGYSADDGRYVLPGLVPSSYLVAIEPLDGDPPGTEPFRVNEVVASTLDTNFPEEFYDAHEGAVETDPTAALPVAVTAGAATSGIDVVTNTVTLAGTSHAFAAGFNLFAWPTAVPAGTTAFDLLAALGGPDAIDSVDRYVPVAGAFERAEHVDGAAAGVDFPIARGEGYVVHMRAASIASFAGGTDCPPLTLAAGLNLIGVPCRPPGYTAFALLQDLGSAAEVDRVARFDPDAGAYATARYGAGGVPEGDDFPIASGEGYEVVMRTGKGGVVLPRPGRDVTPVITGLSPGRGVAGTVVAIVGEGFDPDPAKDLVTFNGVGAAVIVATTTTITVAVPGAATTGPVRVTVRGHASNTLDFVVEPAVVTPPSDGSPLDLVSGQTVRASLDADGEQDRYTFTALAGSVVTITATAVTPGIPDLVLVLEDPFGAVAATDDNGGGGTDPRINAFALAATGTHTIVVTNVPGSGTGAYRLTLAIATRPAETQVSIIGGDNQTVLQGTPLDDPLTIFATGPTGAALAGIPVTFVATEASLIGDSAPLDLIAGDSVVIATNASGIVSIDATVPFKSGDFVIEVAVPGARAVQFRVTATATKPTTVTMHGNLQHGQVGTQLANPLAIEVRDASNAPVGGATVAFEVVSGGGKLLPPLPKGQKVARKKTDPATGIASVDFQLGTNASAPQIVAAFVPGRSKPLLFEAIPEAGAPATLESPRSNYTRLTLATDVANAVWVRVLDAAGNPVPGVPVDYAVPAGMTVAPGVDTFGFVFPDFKTNADGINVASLGVPLKPTPDMELTSDVPPTIDEFGARIRSPYAVVASIGGGPSKTYNVDVDMGPRLVASPRAFLSGPMGARLTDPLTFQVFRVERLVRGNDNDFRNDDFTRLIIVGKPGAVVHLEFFREDLEDETKILLEPTRADFTDGVTDANGNVSFTGITLGAVPGVVAGLAAVPKLTIVFTRGGNVSAKFDGSPSLAELTVVQVNGPRLIVDLTDPSSGLDLSSVVANLNGVPFFNGGLPPVGVLPTFPDRLELVVGFGLRRLKTLPLNFVADSAFNRVTLNYFPSLRLVHPTNFLEVSQIADRAGNRDAGKQTKDFTWP